MDEKELQFQVRYLQSKKIIKEFFRYTFYRTKAMFFCNILMLICTVILIGTWIATGILNPTIIVLPCFFILQYAMYERTASAAYKRACLQAGGAESTLTVSMTEERVIASADNGTSAEFNWSQFQKLISLKNLYLLVSTGGQSVIIPKDYFVIGTADEFVAFAQKKNVPLKKR